MTIRRFVLIASFFLSFAFIRPLLYYYTSIFIWRTHSHTAPAVAMLKIVHGHRRRQCITGNRKIYRTRAREAACALFASQF